MASEFGTPRAPQADVIAISTTNNRARIDPYTDQNLTLRNSVPTGVPAPTPPFSGSNTLGNARRYYAEDTAEELASNGTFPDVAGLPHSPNSWAIETIGGYTRSRDPYRNQGMVGQDFFNQAD